MEEKGVTWNDIRDMPRSMWKYWNGEALKSVLASDPKL